MNAPKTAPNHYDFHGFFCYPSFSNEDIILMCMGLHEAHTRFRDFALLLANERFLLRELFYEPIERWGTSATYWGIREQERIICAKRILRSSSTIGVPYAMWSTKPQSYTPSWIKRMLLGLITIANATLSLFFSWIFVQTLFTLGWIPTWSSLLLSGLMLFCLGYVERHFIYPRHPQLNPAKWLVALLLLPTSTHLERTATRAHAAFSDLADARHFLLTKHIGAISLQPEFRLRKTATTLPDYDIQKLSFDLLNEQLRLDGKSPSIDAALAAHAVLEKTALVHDMQDQSLEIRPQSKRL